MSFALELFRSLSDQADISPEELRSCALQNPVLLYPPVWEEILAAADSIAGLNKSGVPVLINNLKHIYNAVVGADSYPFGQGPLEEVYRSYAAGEITLAQALLQAAGTAPRLSPIYIEKLSEYQEQRLLDDPSSWESGVHFFRILSASLEAIPVADRDRTGYLPMRVRSAGAWIVVVTVALSDVPDGRLYREALQLGETLLHAMTGSPIERQQHSLLQLLGVLHLDPYFSGRTSENYSFQFGQWQERLYQYYGSALAGLKNEEILMPAPELALPKAIDYLERAAALREGTRKAASLKALAEATIWSHVLMGQPEAAKGVALARQALGLFVPEKDYSFEREVLIRLVAHWSGAEDTAAMEIAANGTAAAGMKTGTAMGDAVKIEDAVGADNAEMRDAVGAEDTAAMEALLGMPLQELVAKEGPTVALQRLRFAGMNLIATKPDQTLALWKKEKGVLEILGDEKESAGHYKMGLTVVSKCLADPRIAAATMPSTEALTLLIRQLAADEQWPPSKVAINLILPALRSTQQNEEMMGLACLQEAWPILADDEEMTAFFTTFSYLLATLYLGAASNAIDAGDEVTCIQFYGYALPLFLKLSMPASVLDLLEKCLVLIRKGIGPVLKKVLEIMASHAIGIEQIGGKQARKYCQDIYRELLQQFTSIGKLTAEVLIRIFQLAKGAAYSAMLHSRDRIYLPADEQSIGLLEKIDRLSDAIFRKTGKIVQADHAVVLDPEFLLTAYTGDMEKETGDSPEVILGNLRIHFDTHIYNSLMEQATGEDFLLEAAQLQAAVGPRTVWMSQYFGAAPDGQAAIYTLMVTREEVRVVLGYSDQLLSATVELSENGMQAAMPVLGFTISNTRKSIQDDPDGSKVECSAAAAKLLGEDSQMLLGGEIPAYLSAFRAQGKDHLCITPHGPLHFYPYHLLTLGDKPLAEQWIVTSMPNAGLFDPSVSNARAGSTASEKSDGPVGKEPPTGEQGNGPVGMGFSSVGQDHGPAAIDCLGITFMKNNPYKLPRLENSAAEAGKIAALFGVDAIVEDAVTEKAFTEALGRSARVHLSTHGLHRVSAPFFQCLFLNPENESDDGIIHAYEILGKDLRGVDLLTLSACETALGRFDRSDNMRGLPSCLLLAGVTTIIGTLWEAETESCELFYVSLYESLKTGAGKLDAFQAARLKTRESHPEFRDWGAFYMMGGY